jgi:transcriptional regulator with XRE-family HTH domain
VATTVKRSTRPTPASGTRTADVRPAYAEEEDRSLGVRVRELRQAAGLSLQALAERSGVTRSFLSSVELGRSHPSIPVLRRIAAGLHVPVFMLLQEKENNGIVVRRDERRVLARPKSSISYELLSPDVRHQMEVIIMRLEPRAPASPFARHDGEECAYVLKGHVRITIAGEDFDLHEGDTIYFNCGLPHATANVGDDVAELISAITPPSF